MHLVELQLNMGNWTDINYIGEGEDNETETIPNTQRQSTTDLILFITNSINWENNHWMWKNSKAGGQEVEVQSEATEWYELMDHC